MSFCVRLVCSMYLVSALKNWNYCTSATSCPNSEARFYRCFNVSTLRRQILWQCHDVYNRVCKGIMCVNNLNSRDRYHQHDSCLRDLNSRRYRLILWASEARLCAVGGSLCNQSREPKPASDPHQLGEICGIMEDAMIVRTYPRRRSHVKPTFHITPNCGKAARSINDELGSGGQIIEHGVRYLCRGCVSHKLVGCFWIIILLGKALASQSLRTFRAFERR